jgi:hypothetical protein
MGFKGPRRTRLCVPWTYFIDTIQPQDDELVAVPNSAGTKLRELKGFSQRPPLAKNRVVGFMPAQ